MGGGARAVRPSITTAAYSQSILHNYSHFITHITLVFTSSSNEVFGVYNTLILIALGLIVHIRQNGIMQFALG